MKEGVKKESSTVGTNLKGFSAPFGARESKKKKKMNPSRPYGDAELFESVVAQAVLENEDVEEVVRKRGTKWTIYDDDTEAAIGSYGDRDTAWEKQRQFRRGKITQKKATRPERERQRISQTTHVERQPKASQASKAKKDGGPKKGNKKVKYESIKKALHESMISYFFEQSPMSEESLVWDHFIKKLTRETVLADPKLKELIQNSAKAEAKVLAKSIDMIKKVLEPTGAFQVQRKDLAQDPATKAIHMNFEVALKENNKKIGFAVKVENGRPLIVFPEESRNVLNKLANNESKLLRAELMHVQETALDNLDDVIKILQHRDGYLKKVQENLSGILDNMSGLEVAMLKHLIKNKHKGAK